MNPRKMVVFKELLDRNPPIAEILGNLAIETVPVSGGREVLPKLRETHPELVLLDVAMPQLSGIEVCRQIKEEGLFTGMKVILVSTVPSETLRERAIDAGCDLYVVETEAVPKITRYLEQIEDKSAPAEQPGQPSISFRDGLRIQAFGPLQVTVAGQKQDGELINLSPTGLLFAFGEAIPAGASVHLHFADGGGGEFSVPGTVMRAIPLKERRKEFSFAVGARFSELTEDKGRKLQALMSRFEQALERAASVPPDLFEKVLDSDLDGLTSLILVSGPENPLAFLGPLTEYERAAFSEENARSECVRRSVALRVKCGMLDAFVPRVSADPRTMAEPFLKRLGTLLSAADAIGEEIDRHVKEAVAAEDEFRRQGLNEVSNRLHDAKTRLICKVSDCVSPRGVVLGAKVLEEIRGRVAELRGKTVGSEAAKYDRRAKKSAAPKEGAGKKEEKKAPPSLVRKIALAGLVLVLGGGFFAYRRLSSHVAVNELKISLPVDKIETGGEGIVITTRLAAWDLAKGATRDQVFDRLEAYMKQNRLLQAKVVDETGKLLAAVVPGVSGGERFFGRRVFRN